MNKRELACLQDIFYIGGILSQNTKLQQLYKTRQTGFNKSQDRIEACQIICSCIIERSFKFHLVDDACRILSGNSFLNEPQLDFNFSYAANFCSDTIDFYYGSELRKLLVKFCEENNILWDFQNHAWTSSDAQSAANSEFYREILQQRCFIGKMGTRQGKIV